MKPPQPTVRRFRMWTTKVLGIVLATTLASCATKGQLETNSIRDDLNRGGALLTRNERSFEFSKVGYLSQSLPVCLTYRMPLSAPWITEGFKETTRAIAKVINPNRKTGVLAELHYGQLSTDSAAAMPTTTAISVTQALRETFPNIAVRAVAVAQVKFRARANCGAKDTVFVDGERLAFYAQDYPDEMPSSGKVHFRDVLFIRIIDVKPDGLVAAQQIVPVQPFSLVKEE